MANKLTTMGYFMKRLRDSGYVVDRLFTGYSMIDARTWTVVVDPGCASLFVTCYQNDPEIGRAYFEMYDGGKFIPGRLKLETSSIETFISYLVKFGISNKSRNYPRSEGTSSYNNSK
jgi:hypothetical protein|tara:strand:+ start:357 stop:707 length:351 start_codon:yes stop_codon:yes gene_type:complete